MILALALLTTTELTPARFAEMIEAARENEAKVPVALDAFAEAATKPGFSLAKFEHAVKPADSMSDVRSVSVNFADRGRNHAVGVRIGRLSKLIVYRSDGARIAVPKEFQTFVGLQAVPGFWLNCLIVDQVGIQDAGVRYSYRVAVLSPKGKRYEPIFVRKGIWTLGETESSHLVQNGSTVTLNTIDEPASFFTSSPERLFETTSRLRLSGDTVQVVRTNRKQPEVRAVDRWIQDALRVKQPDVGQRRLRAAWPKDRPMLEGWRVSPGPKSSEVFLDVERKLRFHVTRTGSVTFVGATP